MYVNLVAFTVTGWPTSTDGLEGDLARPSTMAAPGGWPPFVHTRRVAAADWCGELPGVRALAAAAVGFRAKARGRRVVRRVPRGRVAPALCCAPTLPPDGVRGHAPPGARRAPRALVIDL